MNTHTSVFFRLIKLGVEAYQPKAPHEIPHPSIPHRPDQPVRSVPALGPGGKVLLMDEDEPTRPKILKTIINLNNRYAPLRDPHAQWSSREEGQAHIRTTFGPYLPQGRVDWRGADPTGDQALSWWARNGLGALELRRLGEQEDGSGARWVSSYEFLQDLPVRPGLASYGGAVYLDEAGKVVKMRLRGKDVLPTDGKRWEEAKFVYRSTSLFWSTLYHHLFYTHYTVANTGILATLHNLPTDNPLRRLLKPFLFRTAAINNGGMDSLLPRGSAFHRASGLTWEGMEEAYSSMQKSHVFNLFPETLLEHGSAQAASTDFSAFNRDGMDYWKTLQGFSSEVITQGPAFQGILRNDAMKAWWEEMNTTLRHSARELSEESLSNFLTQFFFTVTGFHSWVGHVTPYVLDPAVVGGKVFPEASMADRKNTDEMATIACATGLPVPSLMGDFSHLMPDEFTRGCLGRLHGNLLDLSRTINDRNAGRDIPLNACLPEEMNLSVAI
jgi:hypothetical protein